MTNRALVFTEYGGPETESFVDLPDPLAGPGQVRIAVAASAVNPADWKFRQGLFRQYIPFELPHIIGSEAAGVIDQVGADVTDFAVGDAVFGNTAEGGISAYALLSVDSIAPKPESVDFTVAATLPIAGGTAADGLAQLALPEGATVLIVGIGGGVGSAAAQLARHHGLRVIGTAGPGKKELVESLGAVHVSYGDGVVDRVRAVAPDGVDGILDTVGGPGLVELAVVAKDRSKIVSTSDPAAAAEAGGAYISRRGPGTLLELADLVASGALDPKISAVYDFEHARDALRDVESGHANGKVVVVI